MCQGGLEMAAEFVELQDGILVEIEPDPERPRQIAGGTIALVDATIDAAKDLLLKAVQPVVSVWSELNRDLTIDQVVIELGLGFEAGGQLFIAKGTGKANINFKMTVKPKPQE